MKFMLTLEGKEVHKQIQEILDAVRILFKESQKVLSTSSKTMGEAVLQMQQPFVKDAVEDYAKHGREAAEVVCAEYWWMLALACGMAGRTGEGKQYIAKGQIRKGGVFYEWCQTYYHSSL